MIIVSRSGNRNTGYWDGAPKEDLSGCRVTSNKPIAVFAGNFRTAIPSESPSRDHTIEQLIPSNSWGREHTLVVIKPANLSRANYISITALYDNTYVVLGNGTNFTLQSGNTSHCCAILQKH